MSDLQPFSLYAEIAKAVVDRCRAAWPVEACGLVYGSGEHQTYRDIANTRASETEFSMDPGLLLEAMQDIENLGMSLQAVWHSHTRSGCDPSNADTAAAAYYPGAVQLIVAVRTAAPYAPATLRPFRYRAGRLMPVPLVLPRSTAIGARAARDLSR